MIGDGDYQVPARQVYDMLQSACKLLEASREFAIAAMVGQCMAMMNARYAVGSDHREDADGGS